MLVLPEPPLGLTMRSVTLPPGSTTRKTTSVLIDSPVPLSVMVCPGLADGTPPLAGVPEVAVAVMEVNVDPNAALVPPSVVTRYGPVAAVSGTAEVSTTVLLNASGPVKGDRSINVCAPNDTASPCS